MTTTTKKPNLAESITQLADKPLHVSKSVKDLAKEKIQELIKEETRLVKGIFQCFESPGATVTITVRKYPGIQPFVKSMSDGLIYEIPLYVARHLNGIDISAGLMGDENKRNQNIGTCSYPIHGFRSNNGQLAPSELGVVGNGEATNIPVPMFQVTKRVKRYGFQSMEFSGVNL